MWQDCSCINNLLFIIDEVMPIINELSFLTQQFPVCFLRYYLLLTLTTCLFLLFFLDVL